MKVKRFLEAAPLEESLVITFSGERRSDGFIEECKAIPSLFKWKLVSSIHQVSDVAFDQNVKQFPTTTFS